MTRWMMTALLVLGAWQARAAYETETPVDFTLPVLGGGEMSLAEHRGKWVVLNYWATWCAPCRHEIPELTALHDAREDVVVLGLAFDDSDPETFEIFLDEFAPSYPILLVDVYAPPEPFGAPRVMPTTIILAPDGRAVKAFLGPITRKDVENFVDGAVKTDG